ncbi:MAG: alkaline phosphatase family protein [Vicinamibacterales bacterium]
MITHIRRRLGVLVLLLGLALIAAAPLVAQRAAAAPAEGRAQWLQMFARAYYPGRSGQIMFVPRQGMFFADHDPLYNFMHGSPWPYDARVPLFFHGAPFIQRGRRLEPARQQDVAPTLAALIGATPPATTTGRVLHSAISSVRQRPRIAALIVLDGMRADYFTTYAALMPGLARLRAEGASFVNARVDYLPTATSVGHATLGTGTDPRVHGQVANNVFNRVTSKPQPAYEGLDPRELMALTLADVWNVATDGRAVIIGQGGAMRATAGLVGHGACQINGRKVIAASYSTVDGGWETNPQCYTMSEALKGFSGKKVWEAAGGKWLGHDIASPTRFRASSLFQRFEAEALLAVLEREPLGADDITDLVFVNIKGSDYVAHAYGPDSPEMKDELGELDRQVTAIIGALTRKAGAGQLVVAITADHGMPSVPPANGRQEITDVVGAIHQRFDPDQKSLVQYFGDAANAQIFVDPVRLRTLNLTLKEIALFLESQDYIAAAFTEDEVRTAEGRLPR